MNTVPLVVPTPTGNGSIIISSGPVIVTEFDLPKVISLFSVVSVDEIVPVNAPPV